MINLTKPENTKKWSIFAGFALLLIALLILITFHHSSASKNEEISTTFSLTENELTTVSATIENETSVGNKSIIEPTMFGETTPEEMTVEETTEEQTTLSAEEKARKKLKKTQKRIDFEADHPFIIRVNRAENFVVVYGISKNGKHYIPYKAFICSTGAEEGYTPLGTFEISDKYRWHLMVDNTYSQYAVRIEGQIMLHSIPYTQPSSDTLEYWEYNKLGKPASLGCVRLRAGDIQWIYRHCDAGTQVTIYSSPGETCPLKLPKIKKLKESDARAVWDPTDPNKGNPWKKQYKVEK